MIQTGINVTFLNIGNYSFLVDKFHIELANVNVSPY